MKIKPLILIFLFSCFVITNCYSQEFKLEDLKVPSSPAFILIGVTPKTIESPETPAGLGLSILNSFKGDLIPNNYSLEINPFWLFKITPLTFEEFYFNNDEVGSSLINNFSLSVATTKLDSPKVGTKMGFGLRTILAPGTLKKKREINEAYINLTDIKILNSYIANSNANIEDTISIEKYENYLINNVNNYLTNFDKGFLKEETNIKQRSIDANKLKQKIENLSKAFVDDTINSYIKDIKIKLGCDSIKLGSDSIKKIIENFNASVYNEIDTTKMKKFKKYLLINSIDQNEYNVAVEKLGKVISSKRTGLQIEFASAFSSDFLNDSVQNGKISKVGIWLTAKEFLPSFVPGYESFVLMTRHISEKQIDSTWNSDDDLGLKYENDFGVEKLSVSVEVIHRWKLRATSTFRAALNLEYKISDNNYITTTFGKDFDGSTLKPKGNLITLFGIKFGLGQTPKVDVPNK